MAYNFQVNNNLSTTCTELRSRSRATFPPSESARIERGRVIATDAHRGQRRGDGSPYIVHPMRTALLAMRYDFVCTPEVVIACLLHDSLEDTELRETDVAREFGDAVANYVLAVTRYRPARETARQRFESKVAHWKQILGSCREVRTIKIFDYCDNAISWKFIRPEMPAYRKIARWLREAQELYLPLARITNEVAVHLISTAIQGCISSGHRIGNWMEE